MGMQRRGVLFGLGAVLALPALPARATVPGIAAEAVVHDWYRLILELVRHTATYSPPVASRAFAYVGISLFEALAARPESALRSLTGQVKTLPATPVAAPGLDPAAVAHGALCRAVEVFFANTGPTGQRAMAAMKTRITDKLASGLPPEALAAGIAHGEAVFAAVNAWSQDDGGAVVENMGFPMEFTLGTHPGAWKPTSLIRLQQAPLLPNWGTNRTFCMDSGASGTIADPTPYSEDPASQFFLQAKEVYDVTRALTDEQKIIARFWSDDPMLSPTPPGHWVTIANDLLEEEGADVERRAEVMALLGMAVADAFIACWHSKYEFDTVRPVTYIKALIDKTWEPLLITPPFPEYPSGHSTQSGAAEVVLAHCFGADFAFVDYTHEDEGFEARPFANFRAAADEAGMSRLYGGIHFMPAIVKGLDQGRVVGAFATKLQTRKAV
jgi:hypothetical protein